MKRKYYEEYKELRKLAEERYKYITKDSAVIVFKGKPIKETKESK